jgi:poly-gamma-glutamate capsule biosynthesis protein CapA/YwtB (metallophosphatase superfamily)
VRVSRRRFVTGTAAAAAALATRRLLAAPSRLTLAAAGDCIITRRVRLIDDPDFLALARIFQQSDAGFANCEMTFHRYAGFPSPTGACGDLNLIADPQITRDLAWAGINLMTVANNHGGDYGTGGLLATIEQLHEAGITAAGGGANLAQARAPGYRSTAHGRVALVGCASTMRAGTEASPSHAEIPGRPGVNPLRVKTVYGVPRERLAALRETQAELTGGPGGRGRGAAPNGDLQFFGTTFREAPKPVVTVEAEPSDIAAITAEVARARAEADIVIVTIHSHENGPTRAEPAAFLPPFARACVDAGAHAFFGHGPHVLRGIEMYKGRPIFYSLGNFYFQAETIQQIPEEIYRNCQITSTAPSDFFKKVMGRMFEDDVFWEAIAPQLVFEDGRLVEATLYPVDLRRSDPPTRRGTPMLARGSVADRILKRQAELSQPFNTTVTFDKGVGAVRVST